MKSISSPYIDRLPPAPPPDAPVVIAVGKATVACNPDRGFPGSFWEPPDEPELGSLYLLLRSKQRWVPLDLDDAEHLQEAIWEALDQMKTDYLEDRADYYIEVDSHGF